MNQVNKYYLSIDIGASSGRFVVSQINGNDINFFETYRFLNSSNEISNHLYWDFQMLMENIYIGIKESFIKYPNIVSVGIDTWGVDYGLIDKLGYLIHDPYCYRDNRTYEIVKDFHKSNSFSELYMSTGIQHLHFNTIYQLIDDLTNHNDVHKNAESILLIPDLILYFLTGKKQVEVTNLSTTSLYNPIKEELINIAEIDNRIFPKIVKPTNVCGYLTEVLQHKLGLPKIKFVNVSSHDTASAILAIPNGNKLFISSGTWSLVGTVLDRPYINQETLKHNFTNTVLMDNKIGFLKNTMGMWIISEMLTEWKKNGFEYNYSSLNRMMEEVSDFSSRIDCNHHLFEQPGNMIKKINTFLSDTEQMIPTKHSEYVYLVYMSMVDKYKEIIEELEKIHDQEYEEIFIIGGGSDNDYLNQLIADVTKKTVIQGYKEATILGNAMCLWIEDEVFKNHEDCLNKLKNHLKRKTYTPNKQES